MGGVPVPVDELTNAMFFESAILAQSYIQRALAETTNGETDRWEELLGFYPVELLIVEDERGAYDCCES